MEWSAQDMTMNDRNRPWTEQEWEAELRCVLC